MTPLSTALFRVSIWASNDEIISEVLTVYFHTVGLDTAAQEELPEETHVYLTKMVTCSSLLLRKTMYSRVAQPAPRCHRESCELAIEVVGD